jgi:hypothetical protein
MASPRILKCSLCGSSGIWESGGTVACSNNDCPFGRCYIYHPRLWNKLHREINKLRKCPHCAARDKWDKEIQTGWMRQWDAVYRQNTKEI